MEEFLRAQPRERKKADIIKEQEEIRKQKLREEREIKPIETNKKRKFEFGDKGSSWRMMKLQRVFDTSKEEKIPLEQVALDRFGSMEDFEEALREREYLDSKKSVKKYDNQRTFVPKAQFKAPAGPKRFERIVPAPEQAPAPIVQTKIVADVLSTDQLNQMYSRVLKAKLMNVKGWEDLESEYQYEKSRAESVFQNRGSLPTPNVRGSDDLNVLSGGNKRGKGDFPQKQKTHDRQGNRIANIDESEKTLQDLVREEKMGKSFTYDKDLAYQIQKDFNFDSSVDYMDSNTDLLSRKKSNTIQRQQKYASRGNCVFILDHRKTEAALAECPYCLHEGRPVRISVVSKGFRVYLALPETIDMVPYHCLIVPMEHCLTTLELDDDSWDEIQNFKKCLIRMSESKGLGIIFMEQVIKLKDHKHTVIECIPVPQQIYPDMPAYFREGLAAAESEWSQHKKVIITDKGFRRSLVPNLPYFHVWFDHKRGMGHVIEEEADWEPWFGRQIIASVLDLPPEKWRRPKPFPVSEMASRSRKFVEAWGPFDWTKMIE